MQRWCTPLMFLVVTFGAAFAAATDPPAAKTVDELVERMRVGCESAKTLSADLVYSVSSAKRQQLVHGKVKLMKPNLAKLEYSFIAEPAFPSLVGCDGETIGIFTPASFREDRTFEPGPFDPLLGAQQASGLTKGGGRFDYRPAGPDARLLKLWDAAPVQAFFDTNWAAQQLYARGFDSFELVDPQTLDGIRYEVLYHRYKTGNIVGGAYSTFYQRLYVAPDGMIHQYVLEFESAGARGVQVARLKNVETNAEMAVEDFALPRFDESVEIDLPNDTEESP